MANIIIFVSIAVLYLHFPLPAYSQYHWNENDIDQSGGIWESLWGYFTGYSVTADDELAAFTVSGNVFVGWILITTNDEYGLDGTYLDIWANVATEVYFLVWDHLLGQEYSAGPNYTLVNPGNPGPVYQQDLNNLGPVPEPSTMIMMGISLGFTCFIYFRLKKKNGKKG